MDNTAHNYTEQEKIIADLREKILNERLHNIQCTISRVEELTLKTYEQARVTNGRLTRLEDADTINRISALELDIAPVRAILNNKRVFITLMGILITGMVVTVLVQLNIIAIFG